MRTTPRKPRYLNVILTVNAVFLGALLWSQVAGSSLGAEAGAMQDAPPSFTNAAEQRQKMIQSLSHLQSSVDAMNKTLTGGGIKVSVTNLSDINTGDGGE